VPKTNLLLTLLVAVALAAGSGAAERPKGAELKAILNALRVPVEKDLKPPIVFKIDHVSEQANWAFMFGQPQRPNGKKVDYRHTRYAPAVSAGAFDDWICALLQKRQGTWRVIEYRIGATDVAWDGWDVKHHAPRAIFPYGPAAPVPGR
jgi:hypothetical protein